MKNKAAVKQFDAFYDAAMKEKMTEVVIPAFGIYVDFREAKDWFRSVEPLLYKLLYYDECEMPIRLGGKALITAVSIDKELPVKLIMETNEKLVSIDGEQFDQWLSLSSDAAETYRISEKAVDEEDGNNYAVMPAISEHQISWLKEAWQSGRKQSLGRDRELYISPSFRACRKMRLTTMLVDDRLDWNNHSPHFKVWGRNKRKKTFGTVKTFTVEIPEFPCREKARIGRDTKIRKILTRVKADGSLREEEEVIEEIIRPRMKTSKITDQSAMMACRKYGFFARQEGNTLSPPTNDFYGGQWQEELREDNEDNRRFYERNKWDEAEYRIKYLDARLQDRASRLSKAMRKPPEKCIELLPRYPLDKEPPIWMLGFRSGNLYRVRFRKYVGHLRSQFKVNSRAWRMLSERAVSVEVLDGGRDGQQKLILPWREEELGALPEEIEYLNPLTGQRAVCYEDELFTMDDNRMVPVDLYRFIERQR